MKTLFVLAACLLNVACSTVPLRVRPPLVLAPEIAERGETIYFGSSFPLRGTATQPTFVYERRVEEHDRLVTATHITRDPVSGAVAIAEAATCSPDYALDDYTLYGNQLGQSGLRRAG